MSNCIGLHPYGSCAPGEGERADGFDMCRYHLRAELTGLRTRVTELERELAKVDGYRQDLAERCARKDLELDELRR